MNSKDLVSVIVPTKNSDKYIRECLKNIKNQTYKNVEIVVSDGLSSDKTRQFAKFFKAKIVINKKILAEPGVRLGFKKAKGDILIVLAVDNIFKKQNAIEIIVKVFENKKIFAAFPKHESSDSDTLFTKYTNTFTDPFNHFVYGYAANARTFNKVFRTINHNHVYDVYDFKSAKIKPVLALAQGFSIRNEFGDKEIDDMDDIAPIQELINERKQIAYVHSVSLYHHTLGSFRQFIRKQRWAARNAILGEDFGINLRKKTLSKKQIILMYLYPVYSLSIVFPCIYSLFHLIYDREKMWLFHPIIAFVSGAAITFEYVKIKLGLSKSLSRL